MAVESEKKIDETSQGVFIGWSGTGSKELASCLREWLPKVIKDIKPWMSKMDIDAGNKWRPDLAEQLKYTKIGIICLTPENLDSPWIHYEAGALSINNARVCPYLLNLKPEDIKELPLFEFQYTNADREDTKKLIYKINELSLKVPQEEIEKNFEDLWPQLGKKIQSLTTTKPVLEKIGDLVSDYENKPKYNDYEYIFHREMLTKVEKLNNWMNKITRGNLVVSKKDGLRILRELIENAKYSIFATSIIPLKDFWDSSFGEGYFYANEKALRNGAKIKRIFIKDHLEGEGEKKCKAEIERQVKSKIRVKEVEKDVLPDELHKDFAILDGKLVFYLHFKDPDKNASIPTIDYADIYVDPYKIKEACDLFREIDSYAKYIKESAT